MSRRVCSTLTDVACAVPGPGQTVPVRTSRLEAFSDGVFAIAATLLVLELHVPPDEPDLVHALTGLWPAYAAYLISFLTIGIIWVNHHTLLEHCRRVDRPFLYLNLLLLIAVGIVPFPTALVDQYILSEHGATAALVVYGLGAVLIALAFTGVFLYATHDHRLVGDRAEARRIREEGRLFPIGLGAYSLGIALAFVAPIVSLAVYGLTAIFYAFPRLPLPSQR
jgi:TMEM175 potassium channel family protein